MSAAAATPRMGFKFVLAIRTGPGVGTTFQLLPPQVTIGRGEDCHIVLKDPRVSRIAAVINFSMENIVISDASQRGSLSVNGELLEQASIRDGDVIRIGATEMSFMVETLDLRPASPSLYVANGKLSAAKSASARGDDPFPRAPSSGGLSSRQKFYLGLAVVGAAFGALLMTGNVVKNPDKGLKTIEEIEKEIKDSEVRQDEFAKKRVFKNEEERTRSEEADRHFAEGFRDYEKGQWVRAMRSFETALTIDPQHPLSGRYFRLAEKQRDQMIADLTLEGRRYREKNMFARCSAQFEKVLDMIPNKDDAKYKVAEALKKECDLHLDGRFRY